METTPPNSQEKTPPNSQESVGGGSLEGFGGSGGGSGGNGSPRLSIRSSTPIGLSYDHMKELAIEHNIIPADAKTVSDDEDRSVYIFESGFGSQKKVLKMGNKTNIATTNKFNLLQQEHEAYIQIQGSHFFPRLYYGGAIGQAYYLLIEFIKGPTLFDYITSEQAYKPGEPERILLQLAQALDTLNDLGLIHGDLSLENIIISDTVKLIDFEHSVSEWPIENILGSDEETEDKKYGYKYILDLLYNNDRQNSKYQAILAEIEKCRSDTKCGDFYKTVIQILKPQGGGARSKKAKGKGKKTRKTNAKKAKGKKSRRLRLKGN